MSDGVLTFKAFNCDISKVISSRGLDTGGKVQQYIDSEVLRLNEPFVPKDTGELIQSGIKNTEIGSGEVKYNTPYARRWLPFSLSPIYASSLSGSPTKGKLLV